MGGLRFREIDRLHTADLFFPDKIARGDISAAEETHSRASERGKSAVAEMRHSTGLPFTMYGLNLYFFNAVTAMSVRTGQWHLLQHL